MTTPTAEEMLAQILSRMDQMTNEQTNTNDSIQNLTQRMQVVDNKIQELDEHIARSEKDLDERNRVQGETLKKALEQRLEARIEEALSRTTVSTDRESGPTDQRREIHQGKRPIGEPSRRTDDPIMVSDSPRPHSRTNPIPQRPYRPYDYGNDESEPDEQFDRRDRRPRQQNRNRTRNDDDTDDELSSIKVTIPPFKGTPDPNEYLDWKSKCDMIFSCRRYSERKKLQLAVLEFKDYALVWWSQRQAKLRSLQAPEIDTWVDLISAMESRFLPKDYRRGLIQKIQALIQGSRTVEEYHKEMEMLMLRADYSEEEEGTMYRFLHGVRRDIKEQAEMYQFATLHELLEIAIKVESHQKARTNFRGTNSGFRSNTSPGQNQNKVWPKVAEKLQQLKPEMAKAIKKDERPPFNKPKTNDRTREVTCFRCQRKGHYANVCPHSRIIVMLKDGQLAILSDDEDSSAKVEDPEQGEADGEDSGDEVYEEDPTDQQDENDSATILVAMRSLSALPTGKTNNRVVEQRENLFHYRCKIGGTNAAMIIDSGSCTNVVSHYVIDKLKIPMTEHPSPYHLQWMNESGDLKITK